MELAIDRALKQLPSLISYFRSTDFSQARFDRLKKAVNNPMAEIYLLFIHSVLPMFTHTNQFLQREEPLIHLLKPYLIGLLKKVLGKYVKATVVARALNEGDKLKDIDYACLANQVSNDQLVIGYLTKQTIAKLLNDGSITTGMIATFYSSVRKFFVKATEYLFEWCPLDDELLDHVDG